MVISMGSGVKDMYTFCIHVYLYFSLNVMNDAYFEPDRIHKILAPKSVCDLY